MIRLFISLLSFVGTHKAVDFFKVATCSIAICLIDVFLLVFVMIYIFFIALFIFSQSFLATSSSFTSASFAFLLFYQDIYIIRLGHYPFHLHSLTSSGLYTPERYWITLWLAYRLVLIRRRPKSLISWFCSFNWVLDWLFAILMTRVSPELWI